MKSVAVMRQQGFVKPLMLAILVLLVLTGVLGWFWLGKHPEMKDQLLREAGRFGGEALNFASDLRSRTGGNTPAPQVGATAGSSLPGAPPKLAETDAGKTTSADVDKALAETVTPQEGGASAGGKLAAGTTAAAETGAAADTPLARKDDAVVRIAFIDDLASWLTQGYSPARSGQLTINLQEANLRYGMGMKGLAWIGEDLPAGRSAALKYVFTPDMLQALYALYAPRFMDAVERALGDEQKRPLTAEQKVVFYRLYAQQFRALAGTLQGISEVSDFGERMQRQRQLAQQVVQTNARYSELVFARDEASASGNTSRLMELQPVVDAAAGAYRQAVLAREQGRDSLAGAIRKNRGLRQFDNDTLLYVAAWIDRRASGTPSGMAAAGKASQLFSDLAGRFEQAGKEVHQ